MADSERPRDVFAGATPRAAARLPAQAITHVIAYGQSLSSGWEGWPALSVEQRQDSLMLGDSVRPRHEFAPVWEAVGEARMRPLVATVQAPGSGALLTPAEVAALPAGNTALGETVLEAAVNAWRRRMLVAGGPAAAGRRILASSCGVGGRSIEALSRGASPELYNRLRDCVRLARRVAGEAGQSYGVGALVMIQGESNAWGTGTSDPAAYAALLRGLHDDFNSDVAAGAEVPMFFTQTSGAYCSDDAGIAQAQLEVGLGGNGRFLVGPTYPVTAKAAGHLDANGYRWLGAQFGKVFHRVLTRGETWRPLHPLRAERQGCEVAARFHVPAPPLAFSDPILLHRRHALPDKGFTVRDADGIVQIADVTLEGPATVRLRLAREPAGETRLLYADKRNHGRGHLHDSDDEAADDRYAFDPAAGHYADADIPGLTGRPYPLANWCVAFNIPIVDRPPEIAPRPGDSLWAQLRHLFGR